MLQSENMPTIAFRRRCLATSRVVLRRCLPISGIRASFLCLFSFIVISLFMIPFHHSLYSSNEVFEEYYFLFKKAEF